MTDDDPTAEPVGDLIAQARDLTDPDNDRIGIYLSPANRAHIDAKPDLAEQIYSSGVMVDDIDGKGGVAIIESEELAEEIEAILAEGADLQELIGAITGAGVGKPEDGDAVIQQVDEDGAVTRESIVNPETADETVAAFSIPGRQVQVTTPGNALQRRQEQLSNEDMPQFMEYLQQRAQG